jgi:hypothetical protein
VLHDRFPRIQKNNLPCEAVRHDWIPQALLLVGEILLHGKFEVKRTSGLDRKIPHLLGSKRPLGNSQNERCISQHSSLYVWMDIRPLKTMIWEKHKAIPQRCNTGNGLSTWQVDACSYVPLSGMSSQHILWRMHALVQFWSVDGNHSVSKYSFVQRILCQLRWMSQILHYNEVCMCYSSRFML